MTDGGARLAAIREFLEEERAAVAKHDVVEADARDYVEDVGWLLARLEEVERERDYAHKALAATEEMRGREIQAAHNNAAEIGIRLTREIDRLAAKLATVRREVLEEAMTAVSNRLCGEPDCNDPLCPAAQAAEEIRELAAPPAPEEKPSRIDRKSLFGEGRDRNGDELPPREPQGEEGES